MSVIPAAPPTEIIASNTSSHAPTTLSAQNSHLFQHASGFDIVGGQFVLGDVHNHHPNPASGVAVSLPLLNLVDEDFSESEIYCNQLLRRKRGFPLHDPAPPQNLPAEYRKKGVAIGDVGRVTSEGCFDFGFNIYLPAEHPINNNDVPENFCPLTSYAPRDLFCKDYTPGNHLSTDSIQKVDFHHDFPGGDFVFRCIAPQGAVLALPHGAHSEKLKNLELLRAYAATHAESWYRYMNITRGRGLENGLLYLVTGCEKVQSWGMASFRGVRDEFQLAFKPTPRANSPSQYRWSGLYGHQNPAQSNSYDASSTDNAPWNQTTFIHGLSISLGAGIWGKLFGKVEIREIGDSALRSAKGNDSVSTTSSHSQFSWLFDFIGGGPGAGRNYCADQDVQVRLSNISPNSKIFNPGQLINSYILHEAPQATVVLSHDDDWRDILADSGNSSAEFTIQDVSEFLQQIRVEFDIIETHGATFLQSRSEGEPVRPTEACLQLIAQTLEPLAVALPPDTESQPFSPSVSSPVVIQKKALLVGICALKTFDPDYIELKGAHNDVFSVRDLLLELYGYKAEDITILIDRPDYVEPTRDNILNAIKTLVKDAKAGDHFCFHYCGHSTQVLNRSHTEEDGLDECIIPYDGKDKIILDNELNELLVKPLPAGAYLVAVLDTCHSGALLDLKHGKCNQVYVPWLSKSEEPWVERRNGIFSPSRRVTRRTSSRLLAQPSEINMSLIYRSPPGTVDSGPDTGERAPTQTYTYRSRAVSGEKENDVGVPVETVAHTDSNPSLPGKFWVLTEEDDEMRRCDSPTSMFACNGFCRDAKPGVADWDDANVVKADVIFLAPCANPEILYEDDMSMTAALVEILRRDPNQSVKDVLISISHAMYTKALIRHAKAKSYTEQCKAIVERAKHELSLLSLHPPSSLIPLESDATPTIAPSPTNPFPPTRKKFSRRWLEQQVIEFSRSSESEYDTSRLQNPQLASARPLDMNKQWKM